jgi:hypothetical protein
MEKIDSRRLLVPLIFLALTVALMVNCGGGGGGGGNSSVPVSGTGTVAVYLTDTPADDYENIYIWITEVSLIPESGGEPVVIFKDPSGEGVKKDLLDLRDEEDLFFVDKNVHSGTYSKIRLGVSKIDAVGESAACADVELIKLPSGKIDLNPQTPFRVVPGGVLSITLDVDACKSINLHPTGSGKCIFRPVVLVDITEGFKTGCPQILRGQITALYTSPTDPTISGFSLRMRDTGTYMDVSLLGDARVFGTAGEFTNPSVLREGQDVRVRGNPNASGDFETSFVIIGEDVRKYAGIVDTISAGQFSMTGLEGFVGEITVKFFDETLILLDRCNEGSVAMIQPGMSVRAFATLDANTNNLNAAIILLDVTGRIATLQNATGGRTATIQEEIGGVTKAAVTVFIPNGTPVDIDGDISTDGSFLCVGRYVRVVLDTPENGQPLTALTAKKVFVPLDQYSGTVSSISGRTLNITSISFGVGSVVVPTDAAIYDITGGGQVPAVFDDIDPGDTVAFSGLWGCSGGFEARVVLIVK